MFHLLLILYFLALLAAIMRPTAALWLLRISVGVHFLALVQRGIEISFFPLTNKFESFSAASLALALVAAMSWKKDKLYNVFLIFLAVVSLGAALCFPIDINYPPPLMRTIWYPLHVPLSFVAYAVWAAAAGGALCWLRSGDPDWLIKIDELALKGFGLWSLSMICGGFWGVVAWGAYFMWDVKIIWSVILWFHYAGFIHVRFTPSLKTQTWVRPTLAVVGFVWVLVAYIGTSFLFGKSSHAFS